MILVHQQHLPYILSHKVFTIVIIHFSEVYLEVTAQSHWFCALLYPGQNWDYWNAFINNRLLR